MRYTIKYYPAIFEENIPLISVVESLARHAATAYGNSKLGVHGPTLENVRPKFIELLLDAAKSGALTVCDDIGHTGDVKKVASRSVVPQVQEGFSTSERTIFTLFARMKHLLDWGAANGYDFEFQGMPALEVVADRRGADGKIIKKVFDLVYVGIEQKEPLTFTVRPILTSAAKLTEANLKADGNAPPLKNWAMQVQAEAARRWKSYRAQGCNPTKNMLKDEMAAWCVANNIKTSSNINPSASYLYRHALRYWTPPIAG